MKNLIVIALVVIVISVVSVMPVNTVDVATELRVIKTLPADWNPYQKLYDELLAPTVKISTAGGIGSGVVINTPLTPLGRGDCYVLTAAHVVEKNSVVSVTFYSYLNNKQSVLCVLSGSVVMTDTTKDLALLQIRNPNSEIRNWKCGRLAPRSYQPFLFAPVFTVGCSLGLAPRPSEGIITVITENHWEVSSPILPGNSGGPVFDRNTHAVIGIAVWVKTYYGQLITTMAGIVPIQTIYDFLDEFYHKDTENTEGNINSSLGELCASAVKYRQLVVVASGSARKWWPTLSEPVQLADITHMKGGELKC